MDATPVRSPQAVHTILAELVVGKDVVEIGTRRGDGIMCFAQRARSAVAVEMDPEYCEVLRQRAGAARGLFRVGCDAYQNCTPDADYYTWWQDTNNLGDELLLAHLRKQQRLGRIRPSAQAVLVFDLKWPADKASLESLRPLASSTRLVRHDERQLCRSLGLNYGMCAARASGTFMLATIPIVRYPRSFRAAWDLQPLRGRGKTLSPSVARTPADDPRRCVAVL